MAVRIAIIILSVFGVLSAGVAEPPDRAILFEMGVQNLLEEKCGKCHRKKVRKGNLDLSTIQGVHRGGESGDSLVGDSVADSLLWTLIDNGEMPPEGEPRLSDAERQLLRRWISGGGKSKESVVAVERQFTQHDVLPILLLRCTTCHGPQRQDGGLDLRSRASMIRGGEHGPAMVPGDPDSSRIIQRIESGECPPGELLLKFFVRRPPRSEVEVLRQWIANGTPEIDIEPDVATTEPDLLVTDEDRLHWAFQPPKKTTDFVTVDDFIQRKLYENGLVFSPQADRNTLIRRAYIDLIGMPPNLGQLRKWVESENPDWYASMVDSLLASPHYGERWGRYWLDLAGYSDSEGGISADPIRQFAWKYRDYVIRSFNDDKPYDRFLIEQLAGDEISDYENADAITDEVVENLIATGFLRMGVDETGSRTMNYVPERLKVISDAITIVSSGLMGLTIECARCHSHKYDPIPHRDYYRFKAIFQGALDEHDWRSFKTRMLTVATREQRWRSADVNPPLQVEIKKLQAEQKKLESEIKLELLRHHYPDQSEAVNKATLAALKKADNNRTLPQKILVERLQKATVMPDEDQSETVRHLCGKTVGIERRIDHLRRQMEPALAIRALWDSGRPSPTYVLRRGEYNKPGTYVGPGVPSVLTDGKTPFLVEPTPHNGTPKTGRRLAFARWLTADENPLTARVIVNRIWHHHFGTGIVKDLENFGVKGERPSHPELLDWLALEFVQHGYSIKTIHRMIMNSRTYRQESRVTEEEIAIDPYNRLLSHTRIRRLDAEALRDSLLFVSGKLDMTQGGLPDTVVVDRDGMVSANLTGGGGLRRSVYLQYRRTQTPTMMDTFDYPQMGPNCISRNISLVSPQSLMLLNNGRIRELASAFAVRIELMAADDDSLESKVRNAYLLSLSREPDALEMKLGIEGLAKLQDEWNGNAQKALETYCHAIFNSASFLYVD